MMFHTLWDCLLTLNIWNNLVKLKDKKGFLFCNINLVDDWQSIIPLLQQ